MDIIFAVALQEDGKIVALNTSNIIILEKLKFLH